MTVRLARERVSKMCMKKGLYLSFSLIVGIIYIKFENGLHFLQYQNITFVRFLGLLSHLLTQRAMDMP